VREAANADELLSLLEKATEAYYKAKHYGLTERWRKQMDCLEKSLDIFETDAHTDIAVDSQTPSAIEQDVSRIIIPCVLHDSD
jgi:hypothetical protein